MPLLKTIRGVESDPVLFVVATGLIGLFLGILVTQTERNVRRQLVTKGSCSAITLNVLRNYPTRVVSIFVEQLGREKHIVNDIPGRRMADITHNDKVRVNTELRFVTGRDTLRDARS